VPQEAFFLPAAGGHRFCLHSPAEGGDEKGVLIYLHPFAEELNHARRMVALQARSLAAAGYAVFQIDLLGCGDSSGDFADARWADWIEDVCLAHRWVRQRSKAQISLWGLRAGSLLAAEASRKLPETVDFLFWQPILSGALALQHFLRQGAAAAVLEGGGKGVVAGLRNEIDAGRAIEIGGYTLAPDLARGLEAARLTPPASGGGQVRWFEIAQRDKPEFSPAALAAHGEWQAAGYRVSGAAVGGPAFWQTAEAGLAPALLSATLQSLEDGDAVR
jgi:exosortase A-associated hydrolase 2